MKHIIMPAISLLVAFIAAAPCGAQNAQIIQVRGTIRSVDCAAQQLTIANGTESVVLQSALATVIRVNGAEASLCSLGPLVGATGTFRVMANGSQLIMTLLDVRGSVPDIPAASAPPGPLPGAGDIVVGGMYPMPYYAPYGDGPVYRLYPGPYLWVPRGVYGPSWCRGPVWNQWCR
jgi:hypothetical protein